MLRARTAHQTSTAAADSGALTFPSSTTKLRDGEASQVTTAAAASLGDPVTVRVTRSSSVDYTTRMSAASWWMVQS